MLCCAAWLLAPLETNLHTSSVACWVPFHKLTLQIAEDTCLQQDVPFCYARLRCWCVAGELHILVTGISVGLPVSSFTSASYSVVGKFVLAALPPLLIAALSNARAASSSVSWSPSETVRPRADIWFFTSKELLQHQIARLAVTCRVPRKCRNMQENMSDYGSKQCIPDPEVTTLLV